MEPLLTITSPIQLPVKAGVNVIREGCFDVAENDLSANISVTFQATLNPSAYFINHCLAVLCR